MKEIVRTHDLTEHEIEVRRITVIAHHDQVGDVEPAKRLVIDPEATLYHADRLSDAGWHPRTKELLAMVFKGTMPPLTSLAYRHALGLIDLSLKLTDMGVPIMWRYPETYLHPASQAQLADVAIELTKERA